MVVNQRTDFCQLKTSLTSSILVFTRVSWPRSILGDCPIVDHGSTSAMYDRGMPKIVDHDQRRTELAAAAGRVLVAEGLEGLTTRRVAQEAEVSKGILSHYFDNKADMVVAVLEYFYDRVEARVLVSARDLRGLAFVRAAMLELLPLDRVRIEEAIAEMSFAAASVSDPELRRWYRGERRRLHRDLVAHLRDALVDGDLCPDLDPAEVADDLLALMDSTSLQAVIVGGAGGSMQPVERLDSLLHRVGEAHRLKAESMVHPVRPSDA